MTDTDRGRLGESVAALRGVFANPDIRRIQFAFAGSVVGTYAYSIAVSVYAYRHGGATAVGVFSFVRLGAASLVAPLAASIADRHRRERVMLGSDSLRVLTIAAAAAAAFAHAPPIVVYVLATLTTIAGTVFRPAEAALLPTLARSPEELTAANVSSSTFDSLGSFIGPALGALLLVAGGPGVVFALTAVTFAWSASFVARVHPAAAAPVTHASVHEPSPGLLGGVRAIRHEPRLRLLIGLYASQCIVAGALGVLIVVTALKLLSMGNSGVGVLEAASGIGSLIGAAVVLGLVSRNRLASDLGLGIVLWGAPLILLGLVPNTAVAILAVGVVGLGNTLVDISAMTLLQRTAPSGVAGRVFGVLESMCVGALAVGALLAPGLIAVIGVRGALISVGSMLPVLVALRWRALQTIDAGAAVPQVRLAALRTVPFLAPLPAQTLEFLAPRLTPLELAAGETLFALGDAGDRFYILVRGSLRVRLPEETKIEEAPAYTGEIALLRDIPRTATVEAATDCSLWALEREDFLAAVSGHGRSLTAADQVASARLGFSPAG